MNKQLILKEAQLIAKEFSFWMVSGNIAHLYGRVYETPDIKYELEIKFNEDFPLNPPNIIYHDSITSLLGQFELHGVKNWTTWSHVVDLIRELKGRIENVLSGGTKERLDDIRIVESAKIRTQEDDSDIFISEDAHEDVRIESEEHITPDLNTYPLQDSIDMIKGINDHIHSSTDNSERISFGEMGEGEHRLDLITELSLIQQEYAYDSIGGSTSNIQIYLTITVSKTFIIIIDFSNFPERPNITLPEEILNFVGDSTENLEILKKWNKEKPYHILDLIHELEKRLFVLNFMEEQIAKIKGEFESQDVIGSLTKQTVSIMTYGLKNYTLEIDLNALPGAPLLTFSPELEQLISIKPTALNSYKNWVQNESKAVDLLREISWLIDKNSRIHFEIEFLKDSYKDIIYNAQSKTIYLKMKGKMKTEDITFEFEINLPEEYPIKMPNVKVVNEFELETHQKIKKDLQASFSEFFSKWSTYSYLVDLFNLISKKIFEVSMVSCVICHQTKCPVCSKNIAGPEGESCFTSCVYCGRAYHQHCWDQTIKSFGKCGFCLKPPPH